MNPAHRNIHNQPPSNDDHETVSPCPTASSSTVNHIEPDLLHGQSTESSNNQYPTNSIDPTYKLHGKPEPSAKWNPLFLSKLFLIPFTLVLAALTTALIVLRNASEKNQGFPLSTHNSYLWTYSPTAVLVSVVSGWQQIEYWCKLLQPWKGLRNGPTTASNSVLLDYISPNVFSSLWRAGKLRHISVLAALLGGLLLKLVVVASTGLLYPIPTFTPMHNITLEALSTFKSSANVHNMIGNTESAFDYGAYALIAQNLRLPDGLQPNLAFQRFALPKNTTLNNTGSTIQAVVDVLIPQFHCESSIVSPFNLTWEPVPDGAAVMRFGLNSTVSWPSCLESTHKGFYHHLFFEHAFWNGSINFPPRQLYGQTGLIGCETPADHIIPGFGGGGDTNLDANLALLSVLDVRYNQSSVAGAALQAENNNVTGLWGIQIISINAVVCNATYTMGRTQVSYNFTQGFPQVTVDTSNITMGSQSIDGFSKPDFSKKLFDDLSIAKTMTGNYLSNSMDESTPNPFWSMMAVINGNSSSYEAFVQNPLKIQKAAPVVLGYLAGQVTKHYAISDASLPLEGEISFPETRLIIDGLSFYMMLCGLLLVVVGSIVILFKHPHDVVPCHVGTLSGSGMLLSHSQEFQNVLRNCMGAKFKSSLQGYMFVSEPSNACDESLVIRTQNRSSSKLTNVNNEPDIRHLSRRWWRPVILKPAAFISITLLPASLVITLEILQRLSARPDGIATSVNPEGYLVTFGTRILPSIIFTIVSLFYDSFSFNLLLFAPFYRLRKQATNASTTLHECLLDKIAPHAFYIAFRHRHWAAALSVLASSVGTLFPIFISGLYKFEVVPGPLPMTMERADTFNPVWSDSLSHDGGAAVLLTSIEMLNLSFPSHTNEELALPRLKISGPDIGRVQDSLNPVISLRLPALRGDLSCAMAKVDWKGTQEFVTINGSSRTPLGCDIAAPSIEWNLRLLINPSVPNEIWVGQMQDLHAQFPPGDIRGSGERDLPFTQDNQPGCPTLAFTFGKYVRWPQNDTQTKSNLTSMVCTQLMTEVIVEATINIPEQRLISAFPDESTVKYLPSGPNGQTGFPYRPQVHFDLEVAIWDGEFKFGGDLSADIVTFYPDPNIIYDGFFALMLHPNNSVHAEELLGSQNQHRLQEEISSVYRRYMAQVASAKMRFPTNNSSKPETFGATWTNPNRGVLRQNTVSKIVLQVILAVMFASGISAYLLIDTKTVLQRNPCTIAGMASLLVDSAICNGQLADIVSQDTDSVHSSIWGSLTFSLGWWEDEHEQERRYGIDVGQACRTETEEST
ncbi:hypothetical protein PG999_005529 [Apiospora kogelbergensis]|uniref:Uncharacterized protein n=1 Tax=Apiospora kogelbergensis TaxID=1337665 RepID=A0AAW0R2C3_9PEZI